MAAATAGAATAPESPVTATFPPLPSELPLYSKWPFSDPNEFVCIPISLGQNNYLNRIAPDSRNAILSWIVAKKTQIEQKRDTTSLTMPSDHIISIISMRNTVFVLTGEGLMIRRGKEADIAGVTCEKWGEVSSIATDGRLVYAFSQSHIAVHNPYDQNAGSSTIPYGSFRDLSCGALLGLDNAAGCSSIASASSAQTTMRIINQIPVPHKIHHRNIVCHKGILYLLCGYSLSQPGWFSGSREKLDNFDIYSYLASQRRWILSRSFSTLNCIKNVIACISVQNCIIFLCHWTSGSCYEGSEIWLWDPVAATEPTRCYVEGILHTKACSLYKVSDVHFMIVVKMTVRRRKHKVSYLCTLEGGKIKPLGEEEGTHFYMSD